MLNLDKPFPFYLNSDKGNFLVILGVSVFCFLFMFLFQPFGEDAADIPDFGMYSLVTFFVLAFNILLLPRIATKYLDNCGWTLSKHILFNIYNIIAVSAVITIYHYVFEDMSQRPPLHVMILSDLYKTTVIGIFPLVGITVLLQNKMLVESLAAGDSATSKLQAYRENVVDENGSSITIQSETKETLDLDLNSFLFAQAENNYSELFWINGADEIEGKLMRMTLKSLEDQIGSEFVLRCHRSYMINLLKVDSVSGNANGYRLQMAGSEEGIPVSRTLGKDILKRIDELSLSVA